jgi:hypothetical protein
LPTERGDIERQAEGSRKRSAILFLDGPSTIFGAQLRPVWCHSTFLGVLKHTDGSLVLCITAYFHGIVPFDVEQEEAALLALSR